MWIGWNARSCLSEDGTTVTVARAVVKEVEELETKTRWHGWPLSAIRHGTRGLRLEMVGVSSTVTVAIWLASVPAVETNRYHFICHYIFIDISFQLHFHDPLDHGQYFSQRVEKRLEQFHINPLGWQPIAKHCFFFPSVQATPRPCWYVTIAGSPTPCLSQESLAFRVVWLVPPEGSDGSVESVRWVLWREMAVQYGPKQLKLDSNWAT